LAEPIRTYPIRIGIDTGGTFTDFVVARGASVTSFKLPSTPHNPAEAILAGVARVLAATGLAPSEIVHGTTVATNALLERKGAQTALITTDGFEDVIEIGRQARPEIYNLMVTRPSPLVPRHLRFGAVERTGPAGEIIKPLDRNLLKQISARIAESRVESIAVSLLFSFANPAHERAVAEELRRLRLPVSLSHRILPEYREYERTSTVVINAYLAPLMSRYLNSLIRDLKSRFSTLKTLRVMQSNGGSVSAATAADEPVRAILSGPAGGVVGALRLCELAKIRDIITFDMGGTSTDVALCRGEAKTTNEALVADLPVAVPIIDIHTVGAGGGSIARLDDAGALRVGPESAGANPGPACYGRGEEVTVTDANLVLGRFGAAQLLGGEMELDQARARHYLSRLAEEMSRFAARRVSTEAAALGVIKVANANMERALRVVSVERGQDPRLFTLVSFGGAGGLHVCELADALRIPRVVIPRSPGTLSALGVLLGDVVKDYSRTVMMKAGSADLKAIERAFAELERDAKSDLRAEGFRGARIRLERSAALRYVGQSFDIAVNWSPSFERAFHQSHRERYGYADRKRPVEIVSLRVRAVGITDKPRLKRVARTRRGKAKPSSTASLYFGLRATRAPVYDRDDLGAGQTLKGPAVITEYSSSTLIPPNRVVEVDPWLNLIIRADEG
jgi:N-methylhydantoinase A